MGIGSQCFCSIQGGYCVQTRKGYQDGAGLIASGGFPDRVRFIEGGINFRIIASTDTHIYTNTNADTHSTSDG
jgi:hypothetical protein